MEDSLKTTLKNLKANESTVSMILGGLVVIVVAMLLVNYFRSSPTPSPQITEQAAVSVGQTDLEMNESMVPTPTGIDAALEEDMVIGTETLPQIEEPPSVTPTNKPIQDNELSEERELDISDDLELSADASESVAVDIGNEEGFIAGVFNTMRSWFDNTEEEELVEPSDSPESGKDDGLPTVHVIQQGEYLWSIAEQYYGSGYNWVDIAETNGLGDGDLVSVGQEISIPDAPTRNAGESVVDNLPRTSQVTVSATIEGDPYIVQDGDTLWSISLEIYGSGLQWPKLFDANSDKISAPDIIEIGMELNIPEPA